MAIEIRMCPNPLFSSCSALVTFAQGSIVLSATCDCHCLCSASLNFIKLAVPSAKDAVYASLPFLAPPSLLLTSYPPPQARPPNIQPSLLALLPSVHALGRCSVRRSFTPPSPRVCEVH